MKDIYLDNAATTRLSDAALAKMTELLTDKYGNPSSLHRKGYEASKELDAARGALAKILGSTPDKLIFTSCATESSNTFLRSAARTASHRGKHILTSPVEHEATRDTLAYLAAQGFEVEELAVDKNGVLDLNDLEAKLRKDTILFTCMLVNNEIGALEPIEAASKLVKAKNPQCFIYVDAVQGFGKIPVQPEKWGIDGLCASAHKLNGPKGTGLLWVKNKNLMKPLLYGGGQEGGLRSGTQNTAGICAMAVAAEELTSQMNALKLSYTEMKRRLLGGLSEIPGFHLNGSEDASVPYITNFRFDNVRSEVLLHALEDYGISISSGSACASNKPAEKSPTLSSIGLSAKEIDSSVRVSFGRYNTEDDIEALLAALGELIPKLNRFTIH